jgi:NADPH:quinone reductase
VPGPEAGEVPVKILAASINPSKVKDVEGKIDRTTLPRTPGAISRHGGRWSSGDDWPGNMTRGRRYRIYSRTSGGPVKTNRLSMVEAASAGINYITAFVGLVETARVFARRNRVSYWRA